MVDSLRYNGVPYYQRSVKSHACPPLHHKVTGKICVSLRREEEAEDLTADLWC